ncbi:MAG: hypothetical protein ACI8PG_001988 [Planctomycetota bacterium]
MEILISFFMQTKMLQYWSTFVCIWLLVFFGTHQEAFGSRKKAEEYQAKTALLFNFAKLSNWPPEAFADGDSTFIFAVLGPNPFGSSLELIRGKNMHGRRIEVQHYNSVDDFQPCQVLFTSSDSLSQLRQLHSDLFERGHVLTVGQADEFARMGGILHLTFEDDRLAFIVNLGSARQAQIEISASLLNLAIEIVGN